MANITVSSNNIENVNVGELRIKWNAAQTRILRYYIDLSHNILDLHKELSAPDVEVLQNKVDILTQSWDKKYEMHLSRQVQIDGKENALKQTIDAESQRSDLRNILAAALKMENSVDWEKLKDRRSYKFKRIPSKRPIRPKKIMDPPPPKIGFFDKLFGFDKHKIKTHMEEVENNKEMMMKLKEKFKLDIKTWNKEKEEWDENQILEEKQFLQKQSKKNSPIEKLKKSWIAGEPKSIVKHTTMVLESSKYPKMMDKIFDIQFLPEGKIIIIEYMLPDPESMPLTKAVRFNASTGEYKKTEISQREARELYDQIGYQICLRTVHEVIAADTPCHIHSIAFNGIVRTIDKSTGKEFEATIMSLIVDRDEFLEINLDNIEPKSCFKSLKGISAASLAGLAAIAPVIKIDKDDRRFIDAKSIDIDDSGTTNLAAMNWEDFEHLVRELFEKEFVSSGGEVKITQSSSDGGVDAVAFDPDPIRGGKIVIQAKRYTRTVGVASVRDLYGTVLAEGAIKGILVTTADYGPDAHKFATGKPITLLNGSNLLHLLEKQGIKAAIDITAARVELGLRT